MENRKFETEEEMLKMLQDLGIKHCNSFEEIGCYDVEDMVNEVPKIITKNDSIIIFDNRKFNETYIIDLFTTALNNLEQKDSTKKVDIFYVTDFFTKLKAQSPLWKELNESNTSEEKKDEIEKNWLKPSIIVINAETNEMMFVKESPLAIFTQNNMKNLLLSTFFKTSKY